MTDTMIIGCLGTPRKDRIGKMHLEKPLRVPRTEDIMRRWADESSVDNEETASYEIAFWQTKYNGMEICGNGLRAGCNHCRYQKKACLIFGYDRLVALNAADMFTPAKEPFVYAQSRAVLHLLELATEIVGYKLNVSHGAFLLYMVSREFEIIPSTGMHAHLYIKTPTFWR